LRLVSATPHEDPDGRRATLGDVLVYAANGTGVLTEQEWSALVRAVAVGDQRALHTLFERSHRIVFTLIMRIVGNPHTAEELTLDVFHDVWRRAGQHDPAAGPVLGWILNQARSRAIDRLRYEQRKKRTAVLPDGEATPLASDSYELSALQDQRRQVQDALVQLTPDEREAIEIAYFSGLTYSEVATQLSEPLGTIKTRIRSALSKLRQVLVAEKRT
jgi:RNA polymerase sigma-70 factor (ECF subfamily)